MAENELERSGRAPSAPSGQQANAEEMLAELVRLVESSGLAPKRQPPPVEIAREPSLPERAPAPSLELKSPLSFDAPSGQAKETAALGVEPIRATRSDDFHSNDLNPAPPPVRRRSGSWTLGISALALAGAAAAGSIFWLEQTRSEQPRAASVISTAPSPAAEAPPRANPGLATSSEAAAAPTRDIAPSAEGKAVSPEERPIDPNAHASLENSPPPQNLGATASGSAQPPATAGKPPAAPVDTPAAAALAAAPPATPPQAAPQLPEKAAPEKPVPAASLPSPPSPATATPAPAAADSGGAAPPSDAPLPPVRPATKAPVQTGGVAQHSTSKPELPTKLSGPIGVHPAAKAGGTAASQSRSEPLRLGASANPDNKTAQASVDPAAPPPAAQPNPAPRQQANANPVARAFGTVAGAVGAVAGLIPFVPH